MPIFMDKKVKVKESEVAQSCPSLFDPMNCNLPGSSFHGIFQARILEWVAISFSREKETQGLNLGLSHCGQMLYHLSHQGSPTYWSEESRKLFPLVPSSHI